MRSKDSRFKLKRETTASLLAGSLRERILSQEFSGSETIKQDNLAEEYGVSRIPVREALIKLEAEGLVTRVQGKGYVVKTLSLDDIKELYDIRAALEVDMLKRSIPLLEENSLQQARTKLDEMYRIREIGNQPEGWSEINWDFHKLLYAPCNRRQSLEIASNLYFHLVRYVHMQLKIGRSVDLKRTVSEHKLILELVEKRKVENAAKVLHDHLMDAKTDLIQYLELNSKETLS